MNNRQVKYIHLGMIDYKKAWDFQEELFAQIVNLKIENKKQNTSHPTPNYLIFCQHPHVYTLGKSGHQEHLLINNELLVEKGATFYKINRGGDITYHGPGQLVVYPIFDLDNFKPDIHLYVRNLEEAVIRTCAEYNLGTFRMQGLTGVWLNQGHPRKICAIGVKSSRWVTMHGLAFNVNPDLEYFQNIVPCGITDKAVTSLEKELGLLPAFSDIEEKVKKHFEEIFEIEWI